MARGELDCSHAALDQALTARGGRANHVQHLRHLLVSSGALPTRDEHLVRLERILTLLVDRADPDDAILLRRYAAFHVLPGVRRRTTHASHTLPKSTAATSALRVVAGFRAWLRAQQVPLAHLPQPVLEEWANTRPAATAVLMTFLRWAKRSGLTHAAPDRPHQRWGPTDFLNPSSHRELLRRLLHDENLPAGHRLAGALVVLYGQPVQRLVLMRRSDVTTSQDGTTVRLGNEALTLVPPLDRLARDVADGHARDPHVRGLTLAFRTNDWLFPGRNPGTPITTKGMHRRLRTVGVPARQARSTALLNLAREVPPAILADLLGINPTTAERWRQLAGGDWSTYAAIRGTASRR